MRASHSSNTPFSSGSFRRDEGLGDAARHEFRPPPRREIAKFVKTSRREMWPPAAPVAAVIWNYYPGNQPPKLFQRRYKAGGIPGFTK